MMILVFGGLRAFSFGHPHPLANDELELNQFVHNITSEQIFSFLKPFVEFLKDEICQLRKHSL